MKTAAPTTAIYSCDDHLDLYAVPREVWQSRLPHAQAEQGPRVETRDGRPFWVCEDRVMGRSGMGKSAVAKSLSAIGRAGIDDDGFRAGNPELRLQDLDRDGLSASVIYGPLSLGFPIADPALQSACFAAWNDWAVEEFNAVAPDRLCVLAFLPGHSPEAAAGELERCAELGHRGAIIGAFDVDLGDQIGKWQSAAYASVLPLQLDEPLAIMMFSGALERHPGFKLVLAESGIGWLPYFLARMDLEWEAMRDKLDYATSAPPSELFRRQVMATFEEETLAAQLIPFLGADSCMWASDYPHTDSTFPDSMRAIEETLGTLPAADRRKITATNCARLYGFAHAS
jgi:predicted TIM-barrel fold metal-dependent hydrolase